MGIARSRIACTAVFAFVILALAPGTMLYAWAEGHGTGPNKEGGTTTDKNSDTRGDTASNGGAGPHTGNAQKTTPGGDDKTAKGTQLNKAQDMNGAGCIDNCGNHFGPGANNAGGNAQGSNAQGTSAGVEVSNAGGASTSVEISAKETAGVVEKEASGRSESSSGVNVSGSERANVTGPSAAGVTQESTEVKISGQESGATTTAVTTPASETITTVQSTTTTEAAQTTTLETTQAVAPAAPAAPTTAVAPAAPAVLGAAQIAPPAQRMVLGAQQMRLPHTGLSEGWAMLLTGGRWMGMLLGALGLLLLARGIKQS